MVTPWIDWSSLPVAHVPMLPAAAADDACLPLIVLEIPLVQLAALAVPAKVRFVLLLAA